MRFFKADGTWVAEELLMSRYLEKSSNDREKETFLQWIQSQEFTLPKPSQSR